MDINKENVIEFLASKVLNLKGEQLEQLNSTLEDAETFEDLTGPFLELLNDRNKTIRTKARDEGHKRGKRETLKEAERKFAEKFGIEDITSYDEMLETVEIGRNNGDGDTKNDLTDEKVLKHPAVIEKLKSITKTVKDWESKYTQLESNLQKEKVNFFIKQKAKDLLVSMGADFGDKSTAERRLKAFERELLDRNYKLDGESISIVDKDGEPVYADDAFTELGFDDVVKNSWLFGFKEEQKQQAANKRTAHPSENSFNKTEVLVDGWSKNDPRLTDNKALAEEYKKAKAENNTALAEQLREQMRKNY